MLNDTTTRLQADLSAFSDAGTSVEVLSSGRTITASWEMFGDQITANFTIKPDGTLRHDSPHGAQPYRAFLAGDGMADLRRLARTISRLHTRQVSYVDPKARCADEVGSALTMIQGAISKGIDPGTTKVVFVTADAGAGKTSALRQLVASQASAYASGAASFLYLYVDAQGRALARFNEALATELDDLRATFGYHAVSVLTKAGLLVPVVDGFDELLGSKGSYDDAFASLTEFIDSLDSQGHLVASARSVYYEEEFVRRIPSRPDGHDAWEQVTVEVQPWGDDEFEKYISLRLADAPNTQDVRESIDVVFTGSNLPLRAKPLFVARVVDLALEGVVDALQDSGDLLETLVSVYLERESREKLLSATGLPLMTREQLSSLLQLMAEEMWNLETRELNSRTIREIAEYFVVTNDLPPESQSLLIERAPELALLARGFKPGTVGFEHELFFSWFLANTFAAQLSDSSAEIAMLLSRSPLPEEVGVSAAKRLFAKGVGHIQEVVDLLNRACSRDLPQKIQIRENAGVLLACLLRHASSLVDELDGLSISGVVFPGQSLEGLRLKGTILSNVVFRGTILTDVQIEATQVNGVLIDSAVIDNATTRLDLRPWDGEVTVLSLQIVQGDAVSHVYDPRVMQRLVMTIRGLEDDSLPQTWDVSEDVLIILEDLGRAYRRANPICLDDRGLRKVVGGGSWETVQAALLEAGLASAEKRASSGSSRTWLRRHVAFPEVLAGYDQGASVSTEVRMFWQLLTDAQ